MVHVYVPLYFVAQIAKYCATKCPKLPRLKDSAPRLIPPIYVFLIVAVLVQPQSYLMWQSYLIDKSRQAPIVRSAREIEVAICRLLI